jgi:hypothetical protein
MNMRQVWGLAGGFFIVYIAVTLTHKPTVRPKRATAPDAPAAAPAAPGGDAVPAPAQALGARIHGFTLLPPDGKHVGSEEAARAYRAMAAQGGSWVAIRPAIAQPAADSAAVPADPAASLLVEDARAGVKAAKDAGLHVMLQPIVTPGDGAPSEALAPSDPEAWLASYGRALEPYLAMAEAEHVDVVCLGTRLGRAQGAAAWPKLIEGARGAYAGKLTYAASHVPESGYKAVAFWGALDYVGIDAFFPLADVAGPQAKDLEAGWRRAADELEAWRGGGGAEKPILFTAAGLPGLVGAAAAPGRQDKAAPEDERLQAAAFAAFYDTVWPRPWLAGVLWHTWAEGADGRDYYALAGRPALDVVKAHAGDAAPAAEPSRGAD